MDTPANPPPVFSPTGTPPQKKGLSKGCIIGIITGIIVPALIVLMFLGSLAIPAFRTVRKKAQETQAKSVMAGLIAALKSYELEYNKLPAEAFAKPFDNELQRTRGTIMDVLLAKEDKINVRHISFFDPPPCKPFPSSKLFSGFQVVAGESILADPWGKPYYFMIDFDGDGQIPNPDPRTKKTQPFITGKVIMFSAGPDGNPDTWDDNVLSWR